MHYLITQGDLYLTSPRARCATGGFVDHHARPYVFGDYSRRWRIYSSKLAVLIASDIDGADIQLVTKKT